MHGIYMVHTYGSYIWLIHIHNTYIVSVVDKLYIRTCVY